MIPNTLIHVGNIDIPPEIKEFIPELFNNDGTETPLVLFNGGILNEEQNNLIGQVLLQHIDEYVKNNLILPETTEPVVHIRPINIVTDMRIIMQNPEMDSEYGFDQQALNKYTAVLTAYIFIDSQNDEIEFPLKELKLELNEDNIIIFPANFEYAHKHLGSKNRKYFLKFTFFLGG